MTEQRKDFPEFYVTSPQACPYLKGRLERKLFTHLTHDKPDGVIDNLLRGGFRRSQNIAYVPYCDHCAACVSVRVPVARFRPSRSQRRVMRRNADLKVTRAPNIPTGEQYALFRDYIDTRHGDGGMADMSVQDYRMMVSDSIVDTGVTEYRLPDPTSLAPVPAGRSNERALSMTDRGPGSSAFSEPRCSLTRRPGPVDLSRASVWPETTNRGDLVAVALTDRLSDGVSLVYSFFAPDLRGRSLGRYIILETIASAAEMGLPYVYLGYWISGSPKMDYKREYLPQEHLTHSGWEAVDE